MILFLFCPGCSSLFQQFFSGRLSSLAIIFFLHRNSMMMMADKMPSMGHQAVKRIIIGHENYHQSHEKLREFLSQTPSSSPLILYKKREARRAIIVIYHISSQFFPPRDSLLSFFFIAFFSPPSSSCLP